MPEFSFAPPLEEAGTLDSAPSSSSGRVFESRDAADALLIASLGAGVEAVRVGPEAGSWVVRLVEGGVGRRLAELPLPIAAGAAEQLAQLSGMEPHLPRPRHGRMRVRLGAREAELLLTLEGPRDTPSLEVRRLQGDVVDWVPTLSRVAAGSTFGSYRVVGLLGRGGNGVVYRVRHETLPRDAAVKVLTPDRAGSAQAMLRFVAEARATSRVEHPGIVRVIDFGKTATGEIFLVMELVEHPTLRDLIEEAPIAAPRALRIGRSIVEALEAAHRAGIVHCDLKPDNVFVLPGDAIKLADFGSARLVDPITGAAEGSWRLAGTPYYMAPEYARGSPPTTAADIYGVGCLLFEAVTGRVPFDGSSFMEIMTAHADAVVPPFEDGAGRLAPSLAAHSPRALAALHGLLDRAMAKQPADRYPSPHQLSEALRGLAEFFEPADAEPEGR